MFFRQLTATPFREIAVAKLPGGKNDQKDCRDKREKHLSPFCVPTLKSGSGHALTNAALLKELFLDAFKPTILQITAHFDQP